MIVDHCAFPSLLPSLVSPGHIITARVCQVFDEFLDDGVSYRSSSISLFTSEGLMSSFMLSKLPSE